MRNSKGKVVPVLY